MKKELIKGLSRRVLDLVATQLNVSNKGSRAVISLYVEAFSYSKIKEAINSTKQNS